jgi:hypothetical protein
MANRRRSSVSFQLRDAHFAAHLPSNGTHRDSDVEITSSFVRAALPLPLLAFGLGMAAMVRPTRRWIILSCKKMLHAHYLKCQYRVDGFG